MATAEQRKNRAGQELALQNAAVDEAIRAHEKELVPFLPIYGWARDGYSEDPAEVKLYNPDDLDGRMVDVRKADLSQLVSELKKTEKLGAYRRLAKAPCPAALNALRRDFPHFYEVMALVDQCVSLAHVTPGQVFSLPPLLLAGHPGVGKTAFSEALAHTLGQPLKRVDLASASAGFALAGSHETWSSSKHGAIWSLLQSPSASGILLLEEIDKASDGKYPPLGPLYSLLEPVSSRHFTDENVQITVDASHLIIVATCNDEKLIEPALLSRFRRFDIPLPTDYEMCAIARSVYRQLRKTRRWGEVFDEELPESIVEKVTSHTPRELSRVLEDAVCRAAHSGRTYLEAEDLVDKTRRPELPLSQTKFGFI